MKIYTKEDYQRQFNASMFEPSSEFNSRFSSTYKRPKIWCGCVYFWDISNHSLRDNTIDEFSAWASCKNCLGYGLQPIPWTEVIK